MHASSTVMAKSYVEPAGDTISLSGTTGSPNTSLDFAISTNNAEVRWFFNTDGTIDRIKLQGTDVYEILAPQWCAGTPSISYWMRFTHNAGDTANVGQSSGSWISMVSNIGQGWLETQDGFATYSGSSKVEIATDSGGSNIVATGYYGGTAEIEV